MPILDDLKAFGVDAADISLWIFKGPRGPADGPPIYTGRWVETTTAVDAALKEIAKTVRTRIEELNAYGLLTQNNEASALQIPKEETHADRVIEIAAAANENRRAQAAEQLHNATFYLIKMVHVDTILYAVRRTKSGWKTKRAASIRSIFFVDHRLDIDNRARFDLEKSIDFFILGEDILILDKGNFESTLRYKQAHENEFAQLQADTTFSNLFADLTPIVQYVGVNKIQLRRMSAVRQKGHYRDAQFMTQLQEHHTEYGFSFQFDGNGRIIATPQTCAQIITALLDHRLTSGFSGTTYDVPDAKPVTI